MKKSIAFITDLHVDESFPIDHGIDARSNLKTIIDDITYRKIDDIIYGGDIGEKSSNQWFFDALKAFNLSLVLGNHDYYEEAIKHYQNIDNQNELYYSKELPYFKFIFLDSSSGAISQNQFTWLLASIQTDKNIVIYIHHPILAIDALVDKKYSLKNRDRIKDALLKTQNNVTIFSGHYHFEDETRINNITQYVTPASSYQVVKLPNEIKIDSQSFGYRIIEFNNDSIHTDLIMF